MTNDPIRQADIERRLANLAKAPPLRCQNEDGFTLPASGSERADSLSDARWRQRLGRTIGCSKRQFQAWSVDTRQ
jgi:hypothetical protein